MSQTVVRKTIVIKGSQSDIYDACDKILCDLKTQNFEQDDIFGIHLAVGEALINAARHGNKADERKEIKIDYFLTAQKFDISIRDEGCGFDPEMVPDPRRNENLLKSTGRGILLMRSYMDSVEYIEKGNCVRMVKHKRHAN